MFLRPIMLLQCAMADVCIRRGDHTQADIYGLYEWLFWFRTMIKKFEGILRTKYIYNDAWTNQSMYTAGNWSRGSLTSRPEHFTKNRIYMLNPHARVDHNSFNIVIEWRKCQKWHTLYCTLFIHRTISLPTSVSTQDAFQFCPILYHNMRNLYSLYRQLT